MKLCYFFAFVIASHNNLLCMDRLEKNSAHFQNYLDKDRQYTIEGLELLMARAQSEISDPQEIEFLSFPPGSKSHVCRTECLNTMKRLKEIIGHLQIAAKNNAEREVMQYITETPEAALYSDSDEHNTILHWSKKNNKALSELLAQKFPQLINRKNKKNQTPFEFAQSCMKLS